MEAQGEITTATRPGPGKLKLCGKMLKKIVVIGPESTGKSSLSEQLAAHFKTAWVPEYAREFLLENGMDYTFEDLLTIAKGQIFSEELLTARAENGLLFVDTDMYVMKVWCEFVFGRAHPWILDQLNERKYDLYLLCDVDLPWIRDELREYPDLETRQKLFDLYIQLLSNQKTPWVRISGSYEERLETAIRAVADLK